MRSLYRHALLPLIAAGLLAGSVPATAHDVQPVDAHVLAQVLAGVEPAAGDPRIDQIVATQEWRAHRDWVQARWAEVRPRLASISRWRQESLPLDDGGERTLIYPFSGPDFLNASAMFPDHRRYVFFSLERPGSLPPFTALGDRQRARVLEDVRAALQDIFERNYFITDYMTRQLATPYVTGTVPVMAVMMALTGQRIVSIEAVDPFPELTREYSRRMPAVRGSCCAAPGSHSSAPATRQARRARSSTTRSTSPIRRCAGIRASSTMSAASSRPRASSSPPPTCCTTSSSGARANYC